MIKYFDLLLDLLEIEKSDKYHKVAEIIWQNISRDIQVYHQYAFVFLWYYKLLKWEISQEEFLQLWDFQSKILYDTKKLDSISFLKTNPVLDDDKIYIFDALAEWIISEKDNVYYC